MPLHRYRGTKAMLAISAKMPGGPAANPSFDVPTLGTVRGDMATENGFHATNPAMKPWLCRRLFPRDRTQRKIFGAPVVESSLIKLFTWMII